MNEVLSHIKSFAVLFFAVTLLVAMVPRKQLGRYIRFFAKLILVLGFLYPVLNGLFGSDTFLSRLDYEEIAEELRQMSQDSERITFLQNDYYLAQYEEAVAMDVQELAESYGYSVWSVEAELTEDYTVKRLTVVLDGGSEQIIIGKILLSEEEQEKGWNEESELKQILSEYYEVEEEKITIIRSAV